MTIHVIKGGKTEHDDPVQLACGLCGFRQFTRWIIDGEIIAHCTNCLDVQPADVSEYVLEENEE